MSNVTNFNRANAGYKVDPTRGQNIGDVSARWAKYGPHEKYLSLTELLKAEVALERISRDELINSDREYGQLKFIPLQNGQLALSHGDDIVSFTNWSFTQMCRQINGYPAALMNVRPSSAAACMSDYLDHYLMRTDHEERKGMKLLIADQANGQVLRAANTPTYGRIHNADILRELIGIVGDGTGNAGHSSFKIPGKMDWGTSEMRPWNMGDRNDSTIFRAEDGREIFIFLCQDANPIEAGTLPDGSPDYYFRGFMLFNSDVGCGAFKLMWFYLRGVCANRNLWGVEQINSLTIRHTKHARRYYLQDFEYALDDAIKADPSDFVKAIRAAKVCQIAKDDEQAVRFLRNNADLSLKQAKEAVELCILEEKTKMRTLYDAVQGVTALARKEPEQQKRLAIDVSAARLLKKAA